MRGNAALASIPPCPPGNMLLMLGVVSSVKMLYDADMILVRKIGLFWRGAGDFCLCALVSPRKFP